MADDEREDIDDLDDVDDIDDVDDHSDINKHGDPVPDQHSNPGREYC